MPVVLPVLRKMGLFLAQTWQKIAPVSLLLYCLASKTGISLFNILLGSLMIIRITTSVLVIAFSGMMNLG